MKLLYTIAMVAQVCYVEGRKASFESLFKVLLAPGSTGGSGDP